MAARRNYPVGTILGFAKYGIICQWKTHSLTFFRYSGMYLHSSRKFTNNSNNIILRDTKTMMTEKPAEPECTCRHVKKLQKKLTPTIIIF